MGGCCLYDKWILLPPNHGLWGLTGGKPLRAVVDSLWSLSFLKGSLAQSAHQRFKTVLGSRLIVFTQRFKYEPLVFG